MKNVCNLILDKMFAKKIKVHYFEPKLINLNFDKSITNEFKLINLKNINYIDFKIEEIPNDSIKLFKLVAQVNFQNSNEVKELDIGKFSSENDAKNALREIRVKTYMPIKSIYSGAIFVILAFILFSTVQGFIKNIDLNVVKEQVSINKEITQQNNPANMSEAELKLMFEKIQMEQMQQKNQQDIPNLNAIQNNTIQKIEEQPVESPSKENLTPSDLLLNNLK